jgi:catechol 2,3-dioxygenase-like lactoylglutathione lyase family enzyme
VSLAHVDLVVTSLDSSLPFYRQLLGPLGFDDEGEIVGERGERVVYLGGEDTPFSLGLREAQTDLRHDRYALGLHHLAFTAPSRDVVDERAAWLREIGAPIESGPKDYPYSSGYYAVFFYDPDGLKLEIVTKSAS